MDDSGLTTKECVLTIFVFRRQMTVEFGHCDPNRMVTPRHLFGYFDNGTWSLFEAALATRRYDIMNALAILPLVDVRFACRKNICFGDDIEIASRVAEFRRSSFDVEHHIMCGGEIVVARQRDAGMGGAQQKRSREDQRTPDTRRSHRALQLEIATGGAVARCAIGRR